MQPSEMGEATMGRLTPRSQTSAKGVSTFLITSILCLQMAPSMSASIPHRDSGSRLLPRLHTEHVVLADCNGLNSDFSSQMAYYPGIPNGSPQDVSVVPTPDGQYSLWVDTTTSGLFTTTGVTFTADLGSRVADGEYAGSGDNGYGSFSCWARYKKGLYKWGDTTCSMVYDCDHRDAPDSASSSSESTTSVPASASASTTNTPLAGSSSGELSIGAIIGVSIGAGVGAILLAVGTFFLWRHLRNKKRATELAAEAVKRSSGGSKAPKPGHAHPPVEAGWYPQPLQELDSQWRGAEVHSDSRKDELDGNPRSELPLPTPGGEQLDSPSSPSSPSSPGFNSGGTTQTSNQT